MPFGKDNFHIVLLGFAPGTKEIYQRALFILHAIDRAGVHTFPGLNVNSHAGQAVIC